MQVTRKTSEGCNRTGKLILWYPVPDTDAWVYINMSVVHTHFGAQSQLGTTTWHFPSWQILHALSYNRPIHDCYDSTTPRAKAPIWTARRQPGQLPHEAVRSALGIKHAREKRSDRKRCCLFSLCLKFCPWGKSLKLDCSHWSQTPRAKTPTRAATNRPCSASTCSSQARTQG